MISMCHVGPTAKFKNVSKIVGSCAVRFEMLVLQPSIYGSVSSDCQRMQ